MRRLLREPLLHFAILGALLFAFYGWLHRGAPSGPNVIVLSSAKRASIEAQFAQVWQRPPTPQEMQGLVDAWIREEVFYREGLALGFDRDDPIVRRRVGQKVSFLVEGGAPPPPTPQQLQAWLDANPDAYRIEPTYSLEQLYFDPTRHGDRLEADIEAAQHALAQGETIAGDATMLPARVEAASASEVARIFGSEFAAALGEAPLAAWSDPIRSGFGLHLVRIDAREDGRPATLDEVRSAVERDLQNQRTQEADAAFYEELRAKYSVQIEDHADATERGAESAASR